MNRIYKVLLIALTVIKILMTVLFQIYLEEWFMIFSIDAISVFSIFIFVTQGDLLFEILNSIIIVMWIGTLSVLIFSKNKCLFFSLIMLMGLNLIDIIFLYCGNLGIKRFLGISYSFVIILLAFLIIWRGRKQRDKSVKKYVA